MDKWATITRFRAIVDKGSAQPILCPDCKHETTFLLGLDDEPILYCPWDGNKYNPGLNFWSDMTAIVKEHYV